MSVPHRPWPQLEGQAPEGPAIPKRGRFSRRMWVVVWSLIAVALVISAVVLPGIFWRLRLDAVPVGALIVPWVNPIVSINSLQQKSSLTWHPWNIDSIMHGSLALNVTFRIDLPNGTRTVASTIYLGHDAVYFYIGAVFRGMYGNPTSGTYYEQFYGNQTEIVPQYFHLLLDVSNTGTLTPPEAGFGMQVQISCPIYNIDCGGYNPPYSVGDWATPWSSAGGVWTWAYYSITHPEWGHGTNLRGQEGVSDYMFTNETAEYEGRTGTLAIFCAERLNYPPAQQIDALQMRPGERWVMGFVMDLGYVNVKTQFPGTPIQNQNLDFVDGWPRSVYPYLDGNSSWWPKIVIDLSNPL